MPMVLEARPGGRWFRDLGDDDGHLWGHVQAIKRPTLLEITGPLFMSYPVVSNVQYRLKEVDGGTLITFRHTALGFMPDERAGRPRRTAGRALLERVRHACARHPAHSFMRRRTVMSTIEALLQELEQEAQTTQACAGARARRPPRLEAAR